MTSPSAQPRLSRAMTEQTLSEQLIACASDLATGRREMLVMTKAAARIAELEAVIEKLPKTADGKPIWVGMEVWLRPMDGSCPALVVDQMMPGLLYLDDGTSGGLSADPRQIYSNCAAAKQAAKQGAGT